MKRLIAIVLLVPFALPSLGCIAAISVKDHGSNRQVVELDDGYYLVDLKAKKARRMHFDPCERGELSIRIDAEDEGDD